MCARERGGVMHGGCMCGQGVHVWPGGAWPGERVWLGGMNGWGRACMGGACMMGAYVAGGPASQGGVHDTQGPPGRYYGYSIRSMSGRYASYWNAFLFRKLNIKEFKIF